MSVPYRADVQTVGASPRKSITSVPIAERICEEKMSVLIKGMEMPKNCWLCPLSVLYEKPREMLLCRIIKEEVLRNKIDGNCPLVEIPPHGRLIDADAPIPLVDTHGKKIEVTVAHIIENNLGIVNAIIESEAS